MSLPRTRGTSHKRRLVISGAGSLSPSPHDRGTLTLFTAIVALGLLLSVAFVVGGGIKLEAGQQARAVAEEAARAGAGEVDRSDAYAHGGQFVVDPATAVAAARSYLSEARVPGTVTVTGPDQLTVTVTVSKTSAFLGLIGVSSIQATATASAQLVQGIVRPGQ